MGAGETLWNEQNKWLYYENYIKAWWISENQNRISPKLKKYLKRTLKIRNNTRRHQRIETALDLLELYNYAPSIQTANALVRAAKSKAPKRNFERISLIIRAVYLFGKTNPERAEFLRKGIAKGKDEWKPVAAIASHWLDENKINRAEVIALQKAAEEGRYFIVPISYRDERLIYQTTKARLMKTELDLRKTYGQLKLHCESLATNVSLQQEDPKMWERCQWISQESSSAALEKGYYSIWDINGIIKEEALEAFGKQVHEYIRWAKQQQGY